ncbi:MAG TPA: hybrid sensor histidine kinase/response regulator, partial [Kofleriaceae bacterium]
EAASLARERFLAIVSHELRSPLNGIQSWSHVLESQLAGPDRVNTVATRALAGIRAGIDQQVKLIEHLLDATVALTGELLLVKESMVVRESIESAVAEIRGSAIAKDVAVHVDMRLVDERMDGDPHRVRQIITHLLSNALKFTPRGGSVWLSARSDAIEVTIVVRDSGRGLADGFEQWLFEPFLHADSSSTRRAAGLGLGLALARRLAELHGGHVSAESAGPHLGSTFKVTLPLSRTNASPRLTLEAFMPLRTSVELHGMTALIIDDQLEAREALSALLSQFGAVVQVAASSRDGLALIREKSALPDIVICDIAMPEEDGYGFARRFREYESAQADPGTTTAD